MVKLAGPLLSLQAHGTVAGFLTFSQRRTTKQVRYQRKQKDVTTADRTVQRDYFIEAYEHWGTLSAGDQTEWNDFIDPS